jgi:pantoate--beta-alanine ligase
MSSRNRYLNDNERALAPKIYATLLNMQSLAHKTRDMDSIVQYGLSALKQHHIDVDYLDIRDERSLQSINTLNEHTQPRIFFAGKIGKTRLLDNIPLFPQDLTKKETP